MYDRGDHYLSNNAWASSGDGVAADNWELAGGRPRPSSSPAAIPAPPTMRPPAPRLPGSVKTSKPVTAPPKRTVSTVSSVSSAPSTASTTRRHRVFQVFQRDKLLMGGERELSQINVTLTTLLGLIALMTLNWHLAVVAVLFGGPVQAAIRILSENDPDYVKTYLEGLSCPHIREPE